jgi:hypothetical protein
MRFGPRLGSLEARESEFCTMHLPKGHLDEPLRDSTPALNLVSIAILTRDSV